jgi:hypothetical protein
MQEMLKEKLWTYIVHNNPDLMLNLQQDFVVTGYMEKILFDSKLLTSQLISDNKTE